MRLGFGNRRGRRRYSGSYRTCGDHVAHGAGNQLRTGADNHLHALFVEADHAGSAQTFRHRVVHQRRVFHVQTQTGDTSVDAGQVVRTADGAHVTACQGSGFVFVFTAVGTNVDVITVGFVTGNRQFAPWGHQVELVDGEAEHHVVNGEEHQALRDQHVPVGRQWVT
ncbi:hypothetical protein D3C79_565750 [compost metagenome]